MSKLYALFGSLLTSLVLVQTAPDVCGRVLDNFDDNIKTGWQDFTFIQGVGLPVEANGQFTIALPPAGSAIFSGTRNISEEFELKDGRTIEFKVDLVEGIGANSFAVLAFIPTANSLSTLAGYGFAKSATDILITKGINKYFFNSNVQPPVKNNNVTMVLTLTAKAGAVTINAKVLDKDNADAVIWERTEVDTQDVDILVDGTDDPAAPYLTKGHFSLLLYEDFDASQSEYRVVYDNAEVCLLDEAVLDDFDDNIKTSWQDFTFVSGFGIPSETGGQFTFALPNAQSAIFTGSRKTSKVLDLRECGHIQLRVDLVDGNGKDSFAILAFIPEANSLSTLAGYGLTKSTTDILITKGIGKYFYADNPTPAIKNNNVTLVLDLTVSNKTSVIIKGQVLDKDANDAVIFEQIVIDTPDADILAAGADDPAEPYLTTGHFSLLCYEDWDRNAQQDVYQVTFDNAVVLAPAAAANQSPLISEVTPDETSSFLPASTHLTFKASDDKALVDSKISVKLNGTSYTTANGLVVTGSGNTRDVSLGGLVANVDYTAELQVVDSDNATNKAVLHFDTFDLANLVIEVEDYNFSNGGFFDEPVPAPEGSGPGFGSYNNQPGTLEVDYTDTRGGPNGNDTHYRNTDAVRMGHTLDVPRQKYIDAGGAAASVYDYDVGDIVAGEWMNYTRTFVPGSYLVYLRESLVNIGQAETVLEKVIGDAVTTGQTTAVLGSFQARTTGFQYRNIPLTDPSGQAVIVRLTSLETLRLRQGTTPPGDALMSQNYLVLVPTADPGLQRARVVSVSPADGTVTVTVAPVVSATIQNFDTAVQPDTIVLQINGQTVASEVTPSASGATVSYNLSPLPPSGSLNTARVVFTDDFQVKQTNVWNFTIVYKFLNPANRAPVPGSERGFHVRMVQAPPGSALENSLARAEAQLAIPSSIPAIMDTNTVAAVVNMNKQLFVDKGDFPNDNPVPGLADENNIPFGNGDEDFTVESVAWLDLAPGVYRFGGTSDDGYKCNSGAQLHDASSSGLLGFHNGGPVAGDTFEFVVIEAGLYPFRFVWYERGGSGYGEFFSVNRTTGEKTLINGSGDAAIKAYLSVSTVSLQSAPDVAGPYTDDNSAQLDAAQNKFTVPTNGANRFYRVKSDGNTHIDSVRKVGDQIEIIYSSQP